MAAQKPVTIYTTPTCHFCHMAKEFFAAHKIAYTEHDVARDLAKRKEMIDESRQMGVPVITVGNELVVGFDQERLKELLAV